MKKIAAALLFGLASCSGQPSPPVAEAPVRRLADWRPTLRLADASLAGGAPGIALQVTDELLADNPRNAAALTRRGAALTLLGRRPEAEAAYSSALLAEPDDAAALLGLGRLRLSDDAAAAEQLFAHMVAGDPHNAAALNDLGIARDLQGHHPAAQDAYRQALASQPTSASAQVNLGLSLALSGDAAGAVQLLKPLATQPNATPRIRQDLALALTLGGKPSEAATILARDLTPDEVRTTVVSYQALVPSGQD